MTLKTALVRLGVALVTLVTSLCALLASLLRLGTAGVLWAIRRVEASEKAPRAQHTPRAQHAPKLRLVSLTPIQDRLTPALVGMGFAAKDVRRYVASLGCRVEHEDLRELIVEGLRFLAPKEAAS